MNLATIVGRRRRNKRAPASLLRHQRKCRICNHENREEIESRFLLWENARDLVEEFGLGHCSLLYRHATATGVLERRTEKFASVLASIVEQCESAPVTAATILRAIRAYSCRKADGRWVDLPRRVVGKRVNESTTPPPNPNRDTAIRKRRKPLKKNFA